MKSDDYEEGHTQIALPAASLWILAIDLPIGLRTLSGFGNQDSEVWAHSRVDDSNVWTHNCYFIEHRVVNQYRGRLLLGGNDDSI
jgi:hypothetical protein